MKNNITIAIVDDHPIVIQGILSLLGKIDTLTVAGSFHTGGEFISFLSENTTDVVLLDIMLPDINGIDLCKQIKAICPDTCIIALSNNTERSLIFQMLQNGANGYILKNASVDEIRNCITDALAGNIAFSNEVKAIIAKPSLNELKDRPHLTNREKQILQLIAEGKTTNCVAEELFLSPLTVETHRKNLMKKFEAKNFIELINAARQQLIVN